MDANQHNDESDSSLEIGTEPATSGRVESLLAKFFNVALHEGSGGIARKLVSNTSGLGRSDPPLTIFIHRLSISQRQPTASDPIDSPGAGREQNYKRKRNAYDSNEQECGDHAPEQ